MELTLDERNELRRLMNKHLNMEAVVELAEDLDIETDAGEEVADVLGTGSQVSGVAGIGAHGWDADQRFEVGAHAGEDLFDGLA